MKQGHACFRKSPSSLEMIARIASGDQILPFVCASQVLWTHVVNRQVWRAFSTVLAGEMITTEDLAP